LKEGRKDGRVFTGRKEEYVKEGRIFEGRRLRFARLTFLHSFLQQDVLN
jgi:hypothetical protein